MYFFQICDCGKTDCQTCEAEREAQRSAISWMNQPSHVANVGTEGNESGARLKSNKQKICSELEKEKTCRKTSYISSDERK